MKNKAIEYIVENVYKADNSTFSVFCNIFFYLFRPIRSFSCICFIVYTCYQFGLIISFLSSTGLIWYKQTLSQTNPSFYVCSTSLLKILLEKEKLLIMSNFSFFRHFFYPFEELNFCHFCQI